MSERGEHKMPCGCYGVLRQGNEQMTWEVTAEAFLCEARHKQGDFIAVGPQAQEKPQ